MKRFVLGVMSALALSYSANAGFISGLNVTPGGTDAAKRPIGSSPDKVFKWLSGLGLNLSQWSGNVSDYKGLSGVGPVLNIAGPSYVVLHYGVGPGGNASTGGGLVALYFSQAGEYKVPDKGTGPNGGGGISYVQVFGLGSNARTGGNGGSVPDGGTTLAFLGIGAVILIGGVRLARGWARS